MLLDLAEEEIFDKEGKWTLHRFIDNTSWDVMFQQRDHTLILAKFGAYPASYIHSFRHGERTVLYSWRDTLHHFPGIGILEYQSISSHYLNALVYFSSMRGSRATLSGIVGEEVSGSDLFSFCFDGRSNLHNRLLHTTDHSLRIKCSMATAVAAVRGYYPAQAICGRFVSGIKQHLPAAFLNEINSMEMSWQRNAVATGFLLGWDFQQNHPEDFEVAMGEFRQRGGYNAHYCYLQSSSTNAAQVEMYSAGGLLLDKGLSWLQDSPLHLAAALDVSDRLQELLDNGFAVNARDQRGETALLKAAMAGSHSAVKVLMSKSADPGIKSPHSGTIPLHWLFMFSRESIPEVASLLAPTNRPALLQERSNEKFPAFHFPFQWPADTPLSWAVFANNWAATDALFNLGAHLSSVKEFLPVPTVADSITGNTKTLECFRDWIYRSIIDYMHVSVKGCERFISQLSRSNMQAPQTDAAIRSREEYLYATPLISAIVRFGGLSDAKIETLLDEPEGGDKYINVPSERYGYPLQAASLMGRVNVVKMLLSRGADVDARGGLHKQNALFAAIDGQHKEVLEVLLQQNPEPVLNCTGGVCDFSPLSAAASQGNLAMVQMLLPQSLKANVDPTPALHEAVVHPLTPVDLVELLINAGADIQSQISPASGTPLNAAAFRGNFPVVQKLLEHGACPNTASSIPPLTPLHSATIVCDVKTIQVLLEHGANVNAFSEQGEHAYPLQSAAYYSRLPAVRLLLEYGADINAQGGTFGNALQAAAYVGDLDIVKLLLRKGADASAQGGKHGTALQVAEKMGHKGIVEVLQACCARGEERRATRGYSPYGKLVLP
ncbi:ankyrin repeat-containing domain protein [Tirmania nivea]|nr:ankyrin repeat-containing domain protein [Tirmania nivea]